MRVIQIMGFDCVLRILIKSSLVFASFAYNALFDTILFTIVDKPCGGLCAVAENEIWKKMRIQE